MSLKIKRYPDMSSVLIHWGYDPPVRLYFVPSKWLYLRETDAGLLVPIHGTTSTLRVVDKPQLIPWAVKQAVTRAYSILVTQHGRGDGFVELTAEDLLEALTEAKKEPDTILNAAADTGHSAHHWVEDLIDATLSDNENRRLELLAKTPEDERATNAVVAALVFFAEHRVRFIASEQRVYSRELDCAGTLDGDILMDSCSDPACGCQVRAPFVDLRMCLDMKTSNHIANTYPSQAAFYRHAKCSEFPDVKFDGTVILRMGKDDASVVEPWMFFGDESYQRHLTFFKNALALKKSVTEVEEELKQIRDTRREYESQQKAAEKAVEMKACCPKSKTYKGVKKSVCLEDGTQCDTCAKIFIDRQSKK